MALTQVTPPATLPVSLAELRSQVRLGTSTTEDPLLLRLIKVATSRAERELRRALITQTWEEGRPYFPADGIWRVPKPPLQSVTSVKYLDGAGVEQTMAASGYVVEALAGPTAIHGRVVLADSVSWPDLDLVHPTAARLRFVAGYGAASAVPDDIKHGILMLAAHLFEMREPVSLGMTATPIPMTLEYLWSPYRAVVFG